MHLWFFKKTGGLAFGTRPNIIGECPPKHCQWNFYNSVVSKYIVDTYFKKVLHNNRLILFLPLQKVIQITT